MSNLFSNHTQTTTKKSFCKCSKTLLGTLLSQGQCDSVSEWLSKVMKLSTPLKPWQHKRGEKKKGSLVFPSLSLVVHLFLRTSENCGGTSQICDLLVLSGLGPVGKKEWISSPVILSTPNVAATLSYSTCVCSHVVFDVFLRSKALATCSTLKWFEACTHRKLDSF